MFIFAFLSAFGNAIEGATVNNSGSIAASAYPFIVAKGFSPNSSALSLLINTSAAAPSLIVEALAAVTVPSFVKAGRRLGIFSKRTLVNSSSVSIIIGSPRRCGTSTGTISESNFPAAHASVERLYDCMAKASCASLVKLCFSAQASAKTPIG